MLEHNSDTHVSMIQANDAKLTFAVILVFTVVWF